MQEKNLTSDENEEQVDSANEEHETPEISEHPAPGIKHEREPDAENIMPVQDGPGTF